MTKVTAIKERVKSNLIVISWGIYRSLGHLKRKKKDFISCFIRNQVQQKDCSFCLAPDQQREI